MTRKVSRQRISVLSSRALSIKACIFFQTVFHSVRHAISVPRHTWGRQIHVSLVGSS